MNQRHVDHNIRALANFYWLDNLKQAPDNTFLKDALPIISWLDTHAEDGSEY